MEQIEALEKAIEFAREYLRVREASFASGFGTSIDVVDARLNLSKVEIERLHAMYEFDISLARLLEVSGLSDEYIKYMYGAKTEKDILTQIKIKETPLSLRKN
jgi:outer membrane protein TolC